MDADKSLETDVVLNPDVLLDPIVVNPDVVFNPDLVDVIFESFLVLATRIIKVEFLFAVEVFFDDSRDEFATAVVIAADEIMSNDETVDFDAANFAVEVTISAQDGISDAIIVIWLILSAVVSIAILEWDDAKISNCLLVFNGSFLDGIFIAILIFSSRFLAIVKECSLGKSAIFPCLITLQKPVVCGCGSHSDIQHLHCPQKVTAVPTSSGVSLIMRNPASSLEDGMHHGDVGTVENPISGCFSDEMIV
jgi:hypothetical protein